MHEYALYGFEEDGKRPLIRYGVIGDAEARALISGQSRGDFYDFMLDIRPCSRDCETGK